LLARAGQVFVIDQRQVQLAVVFRAEKLVLISQRLEEITIAVDVSVETLKPTNQRALGLFVFRIESADLRVKQVAEIERGRTSTVLGCRAVCIEAASRFGFSTRHITPADFLRVMQNSGLDAL